MSRNLSQSVDLRGSAEGSDISQGQPVGVRSAEIISDGWVSTFWCLSPHVPSILAFSCMLTWLQPTPNNPLLLSDFITMLPFSHIFLSEESFTSMDPMFVLLCWKPPMAFHCLFNLHKRSFEVFRASLWLLKQIWALVLDGLLFKHDSGTSIWPWSLSKLPEPLFSH